MVVLSKCWPVLVYEAYCANMRRYMTMVRDFVSHGIYPFNRIDGGELSTDTSVLWSNCLYDDERDDGISK